MIACMALVFIHGYFGAFVLRRGIIFIDLALAQWASIRLFNWALVGGRIPVSLFLIAFTGTLLASLILVGLKPFYEKVNQRKKPL